MIAMADEPKKEDGFVFDEVALANKVLSMLVGRNDITIAEAENEFLRTSAEGEITEEEKARILAIFAKILDYWLIRGSIKIENGIITHIGSTPLELEGPYKLPIICASELDNVNIRPVEWYLDGYLPKKSTVLLAGKRASYKSWVALYLSCVLSIGQVAFSKFPTKKVSVLYLDEENGLETLKERLKMIAKGIGIETSSLDNLFLLSHEGFKIEANEQREKLRNFLEDHSPCVVIVDAFRRIINAKENDATEVSNIFTEYIRPIIQRYDSTWILVHHLRKGLKGTNSNDLMDELRGSSELVNYADCVLIFERNSRMPNRFILRQPKCRKAMEQPPIIIELSWLEDGSVVFNLIGNAEEILDSIDLCSRDVMVWLEESNTIEFKTKDALDNMRAKGYSESTIKRALSDLVMSGKIMRPSRGNFIRVTSTLMSVGSSGDSDNHNSTS
jgi:hypothetical protein